MNTQYTPGPWKAIQNPGREPCTYYVVDATGRFCIADLPSGSTCTQANASLVAASVELLEACKWALSQRDYSEVAEAVKRQGGSPRDGGVWRALENAIAKAEGRE